MTEHWNKSKPKYGHSNNQSQRGMTQHWDRSEPKYGYGSNQSQRGRTQHWDRSEPKYGYSSNQSQRGRTQHWDRSEPKYGKTRTQSQRDMTEDWDAPEPKYHNASRQSQRDMTEDWDAPEPKYHNGSQQSQRDMTESWCKPYDEDSNNYKQNQKGSWRKKCTINRDDNRNLVITVSTSKVGRIIGKGGAKIKELEKISGTKIRIRDPCRDDPSLTDIAIVGEDYSQRECQRLINDLTEHETTNFPDVMPRDVVPKKPNDDFVIDWDAVKARADQVEKEKWANAPPLKKNFYVEHPDVKKMSQKEVEEFRKNNNNIMVKVPFGEDNGTIFNPVKTFEEAFWLYPEIMSEIKKMGFEQPSPIQCQAWPILLSGRDLIGIAQTGTGKTLAFLLPALIHIDGQEVPRSKRNGANVLVLAPTRELALQIQKEVQKYSYKDIKCVCVYGGVSRQEQMNIITKGVEIIIATPGRLNDLVEANVIDVTSITYLVLDEADRMLDMGFEPQIRKVLLDIRPDRQSVMTSATWNKNVQSLAERYMSNPMQVYIGTLDLAAVHSVTQTVFVIEEDEKLDFLLKFIADLSDEDKVIVFVGKKKTADFLSSDLALKGISCQCIHGNRDQMDREQAIEDLRTGEVNILIATDVASRGLDIVDITKVFNYDFPTNIEEYVHRVGRTGRAGRTGEAITLVTRSNWALAGELITIMEEANQDVPGELYCMRDRFLKNQEKKNEERNGENRERGGRYSSGDLDGYSGGFLGYRNKRY